MIFWAGGGHGSVLFPGGDGNAQLSELLSGLGLYYSMERDSVPLRFYQKRALRVLLPSVRNISRDRAKLPATSRRAQSQLWSAGLGQGFPWPFGP